MENKKALSKVTKNLLNADNPLAKLRELIDLEMKMIDWTELENKNTVTDFLNSLPANQGEFIEFISNHYVYFLLKNCTVGNTQLKSELGHLSSMIDRLASVYSTLSQIAKDLYVCDESGVLSNGQLLLQLELFLNQAKSYTLSNNKLPPALISPIHTFVCVEEVIAGAFFQELCFAPHTEPIVVGDFASKSPVEQWTLATYITTLKIPTEESLTLPSVSQLASSLVLNNQDLFMSPSTNSESFLTFPFAKTRAKVIFQTYIGDMSSEITDAGPMLCFRDEDLHSLSTDFLFLYDYIIEALSNNQAYSCSDQTVNDFIDRSINSLTELGAQIWETASSTKRDKTETIAKFKHVLLQSGLTEKNCTDFRTILLLNRLQGMSRWPRFEVLVQLINQLTLTAHYFYVCLQQYSPTSIAYNKISETLKLAATEQSPSVQLKDSKMPFEWTITGILKFFLPSPPVKLIQSMSDSISSAYVKSYFWISIQRMWKINHYRPTRTLNPPMACNVSLEDVKKYCRALEVGETVYCKDVVQSGFFEQEFIVHKAYPILQKIFANEIHKNRSLFQLRWLITFAADEEPFLQALRRPLTLLYFQINDILGQNRFDTSFVHLLDYTQEILEVLRETIPDASFEGDLLSYLFLVHFGGVFNISMVTVTEFVQETSSTLEGVASLIEIGNKLCHTPFTYHHDQNTISFSVSIDQNIEHYTIPFVVFKNTINTIRQNCYEITVTLNKLSQEFHTSYLDFLIISAEVDAVASHSVQFDRSGLNFKAAGQYFVKCFAFYHRIVNIVSKTCCYSLNRRFAALLGPNLISFKTIQKILFFKEGQDDPQVFLTGINQPLGVAPNPNAADSAPWLTATNINNIQELVPEFRPIQLSAQQLLHANPQAIKHHFSGAFDKVKIEATETDLSKQSFQVKPGQMLDYTIVFTEKLLR